MCIATTAKPTARVRPARARRTPARLLLVIAGRTYRFWPHILDRSLMSEERHEFRDSKGRRFSAYRQDYDLAELRACLLADLPPERNFCEACESGDCEHVAALVDLGLL